MRSWGRGADLDMLLYPTEMHIQFVQVLQKGSERCALSHLSKGIHILGEALATVAKLAVGHFELLNWPQGR